MSASNSGICGPQKPAASQGLQHHLTLRWTTLLSRLRRLLHTAHASRRAALGLREETLRLLLQVFGMRPREQDAELTRSLKRLLVGQVGLGEQEADPGLGGKQCVGGFE